MREQADIRQKIKAAMATACNDMLNFTDEPSRKFNAEYLLTVNVAKAIDELNGPPGDPYKIFIEKSTKGFARDCLKPVLFGKSMERGSSVFRKEFPLINRNGRIDITVYYENNQSGYLGMQPLCAIELKGFDPSRKLVIADLKRNLEFHRVAGATGKSVLAFSFFSALHAFKKTSDELLAQADLDQTKRLYEKWISEVGDTGDHRFEVETFTVSKELVGRVVDEGDYEVLDTDARHHFVGVVVCCAEKQSGVPA
ncbi:hypothetical protein IQ288_05110 [Burkholderia sp. R-69980]|uniref:hypothetical protein n=1 Tax=Paraburkholderia domus TaxID=2793075 RepID=UPI001914CB3E|nr:hypothetical protein [Paraburkholderia domus]MBK5119254.1 hypothetical protein [Burkholderia sp. R-69980]CAE6864510.1 hypothetical protein R75471_00413 [Paraburkholderia domus]